MTYDADDARQELLDAIGEATDQLGVALAELGAAYDLLDETTADRLEEELFRPVQLAYGRAKRTHAGFAERSELPLRPFPAAAGGAPSHGVAGLVERAMAAVAAADAELVVLQDSMMPVEVGDAELRAGLADVRRLLTELRPRAREFLSLRGALMARAGQPTLAEAAGGPLGMLETALPAVAFVAAYSATGSDTNTSALIAVGLALALAAARLVRRESVRHALSGLVGVAFAAFVATRSGRAEDFFLPGLLANAAYALAFVASIAVRRPLVGVIVGQLDGEGMGWRADPERLAAFTRASWLWAGLFATRLAVQLPLYLAGSVVALGVARTAMGLPLFALGLWLTWRLVQRHRRPAPAPA